jgi:rare lipoprotein A
VCVVLRLGGWRGVALTLLMAPLLAACAVSHSGHRRAFTSAEYGVAVSPRVTTAKYPPRGGGRIMSGDSYMVHGVVYRPVAGPGYAAVGEASWYGQDFHGRRTANGEIFGAYYLTMASPVLPIPSYARVTNLENGRSVLVRVNDRGPYMSGRIADLSFETAQVLGFANAGSAQVKVAYVGPAPLEGDDSRMLMASLNAATPAEQGSTRIALADAPQPMPAISAAPRDRNPLSGGLIGNLITSLLGYSATTENVNAAVDAANAMATRAPALEDWQASVDEDARAIRLELGTFTDPARESSVVQQFAMLGAVDEDSVETGGPPATRLTLTHLKPGVARADVLKLAQQLGLNGIVLY